MGWIMHATLLNNAGDIGGIVGGSVAAALFLFGIGMWLRARLRPWEVRYTNETLRRSPAYTSKVIAPGFEDVYLVITALAPGGLTFDEFTVSLVSNVWMAPFSTRLRLRRYKNHASPDHDLLHVVELRDAVEAKHEGTEEPWPRDLLTFRLGDGCGMGATFVPTFFRPKNDVLYLRVTLRATGRWDGHLRLRLPGTRGSKAYCYLPLRVEP